MKQLISREYRNQLIELHGEQASWATTGPTYFLDVVEMAKNDACKSILDYGCGKGALVALLRDGMASEARPLPEAVVRVDGYDPAVREFADLPIPADLVVCTDVLEHIEPQNLDTVLEHIAAQMEICGFFFIATVPAKAILPDGRNAHLIVEEAPFWEAKLKEHFPIVEAKVERRATTGVSFRVWK